MNQSKNLSIGSDSTRTYARQWGDRIQGRNSSAMTSAINFDHNMLTPALI